MPSVLVRSARPDQDDGAARPGRRSAGALVGVGALFGVLQHLFVPGPLGLSVDEATYLAKVDPDTPDLYWTQVRAWGMPVLAAPVALFSAGTGVVRAWFTLLSSAGLVAAFWPWRRLLHPAVAPVAALLFVTSWYTLLYGQMLFPNLYVALGAVGAAGLSLRALQTGRRRHLLLLGAAAALVALVRPTDSLLLLGGVGACALVVRRLRRWRPLAALVVGVALGWVPWLVEAELRFGGVLARLQGGNEAGLHGGVVLNLVNARTYPRLLDGAPTYCCYGGPAAGAGPVPVLLTAWALAVPLLALVGLVVAARQRRLPEAAVAVAPAAVLTAFYLLVLPFGSLRFLLPITALLVLPAAVALVALAGGRHRALGGLVAGGLVVAHLAVQLPVAERRLPAIAEQRALSVEVAAALRPLVPSRPCVVIGRQPQVRAYYLGCRPQRLRGRPRQPPELVVRTLEQGGSVAAVLPDAPPRRSYLASWRAVPLPGTGSVAYLPPEAATAPTR